MKEDVFEAFSNPIRLHILCCLENGKQNVQGLINNCGLSQSAVSQHLQKLRKAGFVSTTKEGKFVYYSLTYPQSATVAKQIKVLIETVSNNK